MIQVSARGGETTAHGLLLFTQAIEGSSPAAAAAAASQKPSPPDLRDANMLASFASMSAQMKQAEDSSVPSAKGSQGIESVTVHNLAYQTNHPSIAQGTNNPVNIMANVYNNAQQDHQSTDAKVDTMVQNSSDLEEKRLVEEGGIDIAGLPQGGEKKSSQTMSADAVSYQERQIGNDVQPPVAESINIDTSDDRVLESMEQPSDEEGTEDFAVPDTTQILKEETKEDIAVPHDDIKSKLTNGNGKPFLLPNDETNQRNEIKQPNVEEGSEDLSPDQSTGDAVPTLPPLPQYDEISLINAADKNNDHSEKEATENEGTKAAASRDDGDLSMDADKVDADKYESEEQEGSTAPSINAVDSSQCNEEVRPEESNVINFGKWAMQNEEDAKLSNGGHDEVATEAAPTEIKEKSDSKVPKPERMTFMESIKKPSALDDTLPSPTAIPSTGVVTLRGKLSSSDDGLHNICGVWALGLDKLEQGLEFEYQSTVKVNDIPLSGQYSGWFHLNSDDGTEKIKSPETDVELIFIKNSDGYHNIEGKGSNIYGSYTIYGTLDSNGIITMCRKFQDDKSKPNLKKKVATRKYRTSFATKRKRGKQPTSIGSSKSDSAAKKRKNNQPKHPDAGKKYGLGKPGLQCDCCFFDEDTDVGETPFIKCLYCGLVAHSACYPPISSVDKNGMFLCDVCTAYFHPSVNKAERTNNAIPIGKAGQPLKSVAEDSKASSDGRLHEKAACNLCERSCVVGGMKPSDEDTWVHFACVMATEDAYFDGKTAVNISSQLKKNRTLLSKHKKV